MYLPATGLGGIRKGVGDCGCGCGGGGLCKDPGLGSYGLGLFDSMDFTTWGFGEWAIVIVGGYFILSGLFTASRGVKRVQKSVRKRRTRRKRALEREASLL
jgi:hypothetical protein